MAIEYPIILEQPIAAVLANGTVDLEIMWVERNMAVMDLKRRRRISYLDRRELTGKSAVSRDLLYSTMLGQNITRPLTSVNMSTIDLKTDTLMKELVPEFMAVRAAGSEVCVELVENAGEFVMDDPLAMQALINMVEMAHVRVMLDDVPQGHNTWDNMMRLFQQHRELLYGIKLVGNTEDDDGMLRRVSWATQQGLRVVIEMIETREVLDTTLSLLTSAGVNLGLVYLQGDFVGGQELVSDPPMYSKRKYPQNGNVRATSRG